MLTKVILDGPLGKAFGREWAFDINSPQEALRMVDANKPGVFIWIKQNIEKYSRYRVICKYENGKVEDIDQDEYVMQGKPVEIRFVPLVEGAKSAMKIILGIVLVVVGLVLNFFQLHFLGGIAIKMGISMIIGGVIQALTPQPKRNRDSPYEGRNSYSFDGPINTTEQGVPVPLIYGTAMVGSHAISAEVVVDQLM